MFQVFMDYPKSVIRLLRANETIFLSSVSLLFGYNGTHNANDRFGIKIDEGRIFPSSIFFARLRHVFLPSRGQGRDNSICKPNEYRGQGRDNTEDKNGVSRGPYNINLKSVMRPSSSQIG